VLKQSRFRRLQVRLSKKHSRGFAAKNFEACIIDFYRRQFNSSTSENEFIAFLCGEAPSSMGSIVIHVLVTALDNDGFLRIIGAASSRICAGVCLSTLEYVCVSELSFVGIPVGPIGSASPEPNFGSSVDDLPFRGRGIAKVLIGFLQFFTACQGEVDNFPESSCNVR